jgi:peptidoglycan/xylan/chitin deacetylase (PgdA/CDA1 family)
MNKFAAICLHFDSFGQALGFPPGYRDRSFFQVADRFFELASELGIHYTIFVIGKVLEKGENRLAVAVWARAGHEIANHSWSHRPDFGSLTGQPLRDEVCRAHDIIGEVVGRAPSGFVAPGWARSKELIGVLTELGYRYDASLFPSWVMVPALAKLSLSHRFNHIGRRIWRRSDYLDWLRGPREAFDCRQSRRVDDGAMSKQRLPPLREIPIPTARGRVACWHTLSFFLGWERHRRLIRSCLDRVESFHYVVHPADLMSPEDLPEARDCGLERSNVPLKEKKAYLQRALSEIQASGREIVTMQELVAATA